MRGRPDKLEAFFVPWCTGVFGGSAKGSAKGVIRTRLESLVPSQKKSESCPSGSPIGNSYLPTMTARRSPPAQA